MEHWPPACLDSCLHLLLTGVVAASAALAAAAPPLQGPELEAEGLQIGVVTAIAAPAAQRVSFSGDGGHAGAQLMPLRNDASLAGAELALFVEKTVLATGQQPGSAAFELCHCRQQHCMLKRRSSRCR